MTECGSGRAAADSLGADSSEIRTVEASRRLQIQSIMFQNRPEDVRRSLVSVIRAAELSRIGGRFDRVSIIWGDCSSTPVFLDAEIAELGNQVTEHGIASLDYIHFNANLGSAAGHNRLLEGSSFDQVLIINPDTVMAPDCIVELSRALRSPLHGIAEARQIPIEHPKAYDEHTGETSWASTACALVSADVIKAIGGFDAESFFLYCDDVDFSWRARLAGYSVVFQPAARIFHDKRVNTVGKQRVSGPEEYYSAEAALMLAHKYSRFDLVQTIIQNFLRKGTSAHRRAVEEFQRRQPPESIDGDHRVAEFISGCYARHRF